MFDFDPLKQTYASNRYTLASKRGMVATSSALAAEAGAEMLRKGGNAVDAAIATAAALTVVEPTANGIGSDNFAIVWMNEGKARGMYGMASQGNAPMGISIEAVRERSKDGKMPKYGWAPVTVPGTPAGWASLNKRFGALSLAECLAPAIRLAKEGYPVAATVAAHWKTGVRRFRACALEDQTDVFAPFFATFAKGEKASNVKDDDRLHANDTKERDAREANGPEAFSIVTLPDHARTLEEIAETNAESFYRGALAEKIDAASRKHGGYLRKEDLAAHHSAWVKPISVDYRGTTVLELPPANQGLVCLEALQILSNFSFEKAPDERYFHRAFEAMKIAFADGKAYITDPKKMRIKAEELLAKDYCAHRAAEIDDVAQVWKHETPHGSNTVYLATGDAQGNLVSMIQSNYMGFGSGIVVEGTGIALQNRGADFSLDSAAANALEPGKKTYHTIIPGMLAKDGVGFCAFGVMGGYMQPQGHLQVVSQLIDFGENPQMALDAPRWQWIEGKQFEVEKTFDQGIVAALRKRGHEIAVSSNTPSFGRGQIVMRKEDGVLLGATESRTDGNIAMA